MKLLILIFLQVLWYLFIKYSDIEYNWSFPIIAAIIVCLIDYKYTLLRNLVMIFFLVVCGIIIDGALLYADIIKFSQWNQPISPPFMLAIWIIFLPYYQIGFKKMRSKLWLSSLLAFIFAPISYISGSKIGSLEVTQTLPELLLISIQWAIFLPISIKTEQTLTTSL